MPKNNTLEQAKIISRELSRFNQIDKALNDIQAIINGKATMTLEYLQVTEQQLNKAHDLADRDKDEAYTSLTHLVNEGTR